VQSRPDEESEQNGYHVSITYSGVEPTVRAVDIIAKKRDGLPLSQDEIVWFIDAFTKGDLPDYQAAAFLMAVCIRGMSREETVHLTLAMARSGEVLDLSGVMPYAVDKHSSGGVGDKTSLVVLPLVASFGVPVAKMSGRGLGFSGGTLDKLESIAGFHVNLSERDFLRCPGHGLVLAGRPALARQTASCTRCVT
jgi:thymidine phosphorylase